MAEYYLISQLPSLDGIGDSMPLPITWERFDELCRGFLGKKALERMNDLTLVPPKDFEGSDSALLDAWNARERDLRLALAKVRADKRGKPFDLCGRAVGVEDVKTAQSASEMDDPMEAERFLNEYRLRLLESLRPTDGFSLDYVYYYGIKLKLLTRMRRFVAASGEAEYKNIYDSVLNGDRLEDR